jgi:hypothetical protein
LCEIWGSHGGEDDDVVLGFDVLTICFSETSVSTCESTRRQIPEQRHRLLITTHRCEVGFSTVISIETKARNRFSLGDIRVLTAASVRMTVFWDVAPRCLAETDWRYRGDYYYHHQSPWWWK